ncbi:hypothetical protein RSAG8_06374, partial [Rhizoctonia solani AG-8 WAC10335]
MSNRKRATSVFDIFIKRPRINSRDPSPTPDQNIPDLLISSPTGSTGAPTPTEGTSNLTSPAYISQPRFPSTYGSTEPARKGTGLKSLLKALGSGANAFGPLKPAISALIKLIEGASKGSSEHEKLRQELEELSDDLAKRVTQPIGPLMTSSVQHFIIAIQGEIDQLEQKLKENTGRRLADAIEDSGEILESYRRIYNHLQRLMLSVNMDICEGINGQTIESRLDKMSSAMAAVYNSAESDDVKRGMCTPGTRKPQIEFILEWARTPGAGRTCWMNGMAGTGKTTIAYSVCHKLEQAAQLGASFFCSRSIPECRQVKNIIPTIAHQLARFSPLFCSSLNKVLEANPDVHTRALSIQYQKLLVQPIQESQLSLPIDLIVVIDALDECENENSLGQILDLLLSNASNLPIRFLVSSRPEMEICRRMKVRVDEHGNARLVLHDLDADAVKSDIEAYMRHELGQIPLTDSQWSSLIERCGVLFIYASTTCRLVKQGYEMRSLDEAVSMIVSQTAASIRQEESGIDALYSTILAAAFNRSKMSEANRQRMKDVLETVICAFEPMGLDTLAGVLRLNGAEQAYALLQPLRSVLNVTTARLVTTLHASFPDFMFSFGRSADFQCVAAYRHTVLAESCLQIIDAVEPKFNICGLSSSYLFDEEVENIEKRVNQAISPLLVYACRYWSTHLSLGEERQDLIASIHRFFSERLLLWMEILNLTGHMRFGTSIIQHAEKWCRGRGIVPNGLTMIVRDAGQFVSVYAHHPICQKPTGTAITRRQPALLATWRISFGKVRSISLSSNGSRIAASAGGAIDLLDTLTGDELIHIQGPQTKGVRAITMSPDGTQIAFGGKSGVYLLDVRTETIEEVLKPSCTACSIVFSPDGSQFAFGLSDGNIHVYPSQKGDPVLDPLKGHTGVVRSIAFSPNGLFLASGSDDNTIRVWDAKSGQMVDNPLNLPGQARSLSYSPDGIHLASASDDDTIQVWDLFTGQTILGPLDHPLLTSTIFSPDGSFIALASLNGTVQVNNAKTGQMVLGPLHGHTDYVKSVIFSPDSTQLFSSSHDGTIRLWNVQDLDAPNSSQPTFSHCFMSVRYSPDGQRVVSGSNDGSVCIWDVQTGEMVLGPLKGHFWPVNGVDFSPNNAYIASASSDFTLRIWSAQDGRDLHGPIRGNTSNVQCVRFSPDGSLLASASYDGTVRLWDMASGQSVIEPLEGHSGGVYSVAFSPNGSLVAGGSAGTIQVWDITTGQTVVALEGYEQGVSSVEFSPDSSQILSCSWDGYIQTWDAQTGQTLLVWGKDQEKIISASFSPDGLFLISTSASDYKIQIWEAQTGDLILTLKGHSDFVHSVQFSPNGSQVVSCSDDGIIRFWDVSSRKANLQLNRLKGPDGVNVSTDSTPGPWSLKSSGWLVDQWRQLLVWVPDDLHITVP